MPAMSGIVPIVHRIEVTTDADAGLAVQPRVATRIGPVHQEHGRSVADHDVWNELLVRRVLLGSRAVEVRSVVGDGSAQPPKQPFVGATDSVEITAVRYGGPGQHQDLFGHRSSLSGPA